MKVMQFSSRTNWDTAESDLAQLLRKKRAAGQIVSDLTISNPTRCGFDYPENFLNVLNNPAASDYDPQPTGILIAREAVSGYYADHGATVYPGKIVLTTSTSEAYGYLFKLLCDFGDEVLVPVPSYPLFEFLADLEGVKVVATPLVYDHGWQIDTASLRQRITSRTKAIVIVHPNNPTGHFTKPEEGEALAQLCREFNLALIVDEVFLDYELSSGPNSKPISDNKEASTFASYDLNCLVFILSGMSKIAGLPQVKSAWLAAFGPGSSGAIERLEVIADTYLSVSSPVQFALPVWMAERTAIQDQIRARTRHNLKQLDELLGGQKDGTVLVNRLTVEAGWYAVLRIPAWQADELTVRELLEIGIWVHPGYYFGCPSSGWLVVSLLGDSAEFALGISGILAHLVHTFSEP